MESKTSHEVNLSGESSETVLSKKERPVRRGIWRYSMRLPCDGNQTQQFWDFVAAHVEDNARQKPCPLAAKVWKILSARVMPSYGPRTKKEKAGAGIPLSMPGHLSSWIGAGPPISLIWNEK